MNITENSSSVSNNSNNSEHINAFIAHFNLIPICLGLVGNTICFLIFRFHSSFNQMPSMVFLSFVAVTDTIALFEWNLNHFTILVYGVDISISSLAYCKIYTFTQYTVLQSSALILSVMCIDRYVTVVSMPGSFMSKLPFRTNRTAFFWSLGIVIFAILFNFHIIILLGVFVEDPNNNSSLIIDCLTFTTGFHGSQWDQVNMIIYNVIPFIIMMTFNCLLVLNIRKSGGSHNENAKAIAKKRNLTISLLSVCILFFVMTTPGNLIFGYFYDSALASIGLQSIYIIDDISFLNHSILFIICFITNQKFRKTILEFCCGRCKKRNKGVNLSSSSEQTVSKKV